MATMATTSHGLSVYVNSCVKNPIKSKDRAIGIAANGEGIHPRFLATDPGPNAGSSYEFIEDELGRSMPARASFEDVETQLRNLSDEQFYLKLQQLKESNRKTLEECEKLFQQKYGAGDKPVGNLEAKDMVDSMFAAKLAERSGRSDRGSSSDINGETNGFSPYGLSSKPPPVPGLGRRDPNLAKTAPVRGVLLPRQRPKSAPSVDRELIPRRAYSLDDDDWRRAMMVSSDISDDDVDEVQSEGPTDPELLAAVSRIRDMWQGFKMEPGERRHSVGSRSKKKKEEKDLAENWRHRITIPKPFSMSEREEQRVRKKTKAQQEVEEKRQERLRQEEVECQKKFKAQPVPAHVYLPLYDEIKEKNETRRRYVKQCCQDLLKSQEKPFNFTKREEEKKQQRVQSATVAERIARSAELARKKEKFKARPVPEFVYGSSARDRQLEEEEYRKIRIKMRARELMKEASLPPNMAALEELKRQKEKDKLLQAQRKNRTRSKKKSSHQVPDYDFLYREFQKELARRKLVKEATVVEPFDLSRGNVRSRSEKVMRDMERDDRLIRETARGTPRTSLGQYSSHCIFL
jgi:protein FAM161A